MRSRSNHLRSNQTKSLTLFPPHMLSFPLDDICIKPQVHKLMSPRQYHHFASDGQCLTGILPRFLSGCGRRYESCSPHVCVWPLRSSGSYGVYRLLAKHLRKDSLLGWKGYRQGQNVLVSFKKRHLWIYLLQSWATHLLYKYFDFGPNFKVSQAKSDHNFNLNTQHKSLFSKFQTFPLLLGNIIA